MSSNLPALLQSGAVIIDVRTVREFNGGHVKNSVNIPLDQINQNLAKIKAYKKPIITCCASGMRSGVAARQLRGADIDATNGGAWQSVEYAVSQS